MRIRKRNTDLSNAHEVGWNHKLVNIKNMTILFKSLYMKDEKAK